MSKSTKVEKRLKKSKGQVKSLEAALKKSKKKAGKLAKKLKGAIKQLKTGKKAKK